MAATGGHQRRLGAGGGENGRGGGGWGVDGSGAPPSSDAPLIHLPPPPPANGGGSGREERSKARDGSPCYSERGEVGAPPPPLPPCPAAWGWYPKSGARLSTSAKPPPGASSFPTSHTVTSMASAALPRQESHLERQKRPPRQEVSTDCVAGNRVSRGPSPQLLTVARHPDVTAWFASTMQVGKS